MLFAIIVCVTSSIGDRANEETLVVQKLGREQKLTGRQLVPRAFFLKALGMRLSGRKWSNLCVTRLLNGKACYAGYSSYVQPLTEGTSKNLKHLLKFT